MQNFLVVGRKGQQGQKCVTTSNFTAIGRTLAEIWRFFDFSRWRPPPSWIFKCGKFRGGKGSRRPKRVTMPNFAEIGQTLRAFGSLYHCAKFGWNWRTGFDNMHVFRLEQFGWRTPIHAPIIGVLGGFDPLSRKAYQWNPQKAHPWAERRHTTYRSSKSVHRWDLCAWRRDQKRKKDKDRNLTVANWLFAETTHVVASKWNLAWWVVFRW